MTTTTQRINRIVESVSKGIDFLYELNSHKNMSAVELYVLEKVEKPKAKRLSLNEKGELLLIENKCERFISQESLERQKIEKIVNKSVDYLDETISEKVIDKNWIVAFIKSIKNDESELKINTWSRMLAKEVSSPEKISINTIEFFRNISDHDFEIFKQACKLALNSGRILKINKEEKAFEKYGLGSTKISRLIEAGLLYKNAALYTEHKCEHSATNILMFGNINITYTNNHLTVFEFPQVLFTTAGKELLQLIDVDRNLNYLNDLIESKRKIDYLFDID